MHNDKNPDPTPVEWPVGVRTPESLEQKIARMVRTGVSEAAMHNGYESFEEADDFDVEDPEELPGSRHELDDDQERIMRDQELVRRIPREFRTAFERDLARRRAKVAEQVHKDKDRPVEKSTDEQILQPSGVAAE